MQLLPSTMTMLAASVAGVGCWASNASIMRGMGKDTSAKMFLKHAGMHMAVGVACLMALLVVVYRAERATIAAVKALRRGKAQQQEKPKETESTHGDDKDDKKQR